MSRERRERIEIILEPLLHSGPVAVRLRRLLKIALRAFGFRCIDMRIVPESEQTIPETPGENKP